MKHLAKTLRFMKSKVAIPDVAVAKKCVNGSGGVGMWACGAFQLVPGYDREMTTKEVYPYQNMAPSAAGSPHTGERGDVLLDVQTS